MEPIDIYNSFEFKNVKRAGRNARLIYNIAKFGRKGLNVNPATVYIVPDRKVIFGDFLGFSKSCCSSPQSLFRGVGIIF